MNRKTNYRFVTAVLVLVLAVAVIPSLAEGEDIYFTAVNDTLNKLDAATMPFYDKDQYYVPYKIFDDLSLGVYYTYNKENHTLTFFNRRNTLIFQLLLGYSYDNNQQYRESAVNKNNTLYIPIKFVCERFGLDFQVIKTPVQVIRVVSDAELSQNEFKDKFYNRIVSEGKDYLGTGQDTTPSPGTPTYPGVSPTPSDGPKVIPEVYLSFDCFLTGDKESEKRDGLKNLLDTLEEHGVTAAFFLTGDFIDSERDTVIRIIGMGHTVGLLVPESGADYNDLTDLQGVIDYLDRSNKLLDSYTFTKTKLCRVRSELQDSDMELLRDQLWDAGFAAWGWTMDADNSVNTTAWQTAQRWTSEIMEYAGNMEPVVFRMEVKEETYRAVASLINFLDDEDAVIRTITPAKDPNKTIR